MIYSLTTHKIAYCMTRFWHANCMTSLKGHRTLLPPSYLFNNLRLLVTVTFDPLHRSFDGSFSNILQATMFQDISEEVGHICFIVIIARLINDGNT